MLGFILYEAIEVGFYSVKLVYNTITGTYSYFYPPSIDNSANSEVVSNLQEKLDEMQQELDALREKVKNNSQN
jgi:hypothetical protein